MKRTAIITGAGRGLGELLAIAFSKSKYNVILNGRNIDNLVLVQKKVPNSYIICGNICSEGVLQNLSEVSHGRGVDVLINNAGMPSLGRSFKNISEQDIDDMIHTNVLSPIKLIRKIYKQLQQVGGTIININSVCGREIKKNRAIYCCSRWAMRAFDDCLRQECESDGIKVLSIFMSRVKTRPEYTDGLEPSFVVDSIMDWHVKGLSGSFILDDRPDSLSTSKGV